MGGLVLGSTLNYPDLLAYVAGIALGALSDHVFRTKKKKPQPNGYSKMM